MKIVYFADGPWSHRALERICADPRFKITCIVPRFDARDPVLAQFAEQLDVDYLLLENVNAPESIDLLLRYEADLFVSMSYNQIFRSAVIAVAPQGVINCHAGALPFYRGRNILNWALINDAREVGVTVHDVHEGIDTGDIIVQRKTPVGDADTYATLLERAVTLCADALLEALDQLVRGAAHRTRQSAYHPVGTYFGRRREGDEWIDWSWSSRRIFNFVRAIAPPGPGARTLRGDEIVQVLAAEEIAGAPTYIATPGEVVGRTPRGFVVKTGDSTVLITSSSSASNRPLAMGTRLGVQPMAAQAALASAQQRIADLERRVQALEAGQ